MKQYMSPAIALVSLASTDVITLSLENGQADFDTLNFAIDESVWG